MTDEEESEKAGLKVNIRKSKIVASGPITSWQIDGRTVEAVTDFIFLGSKIPAMVMSSMKLKDSCYGFSSSHVWMWELDYKES